MQDLAAIRTLKAFQIKASKYLVSLLGLRKLTAGEALTRNIQQQQQKLRTYYIIISHLRGLFPRFSSQCLPQAWQSYQRQ